MKAEEWEVYDLNPGPPGLAAAILLATPPYSKLLPLMEKGERVDYSKFPETARAGSNGQNEKSFLASPSDMEYGSAEFLLISIPQRQTGNHLNIQHKKTVKSVMAHLCSRIQFNH